MFLSPFGLISLAALDSSMLFFLPAAVDMAVIILVARSPEYFWAFPVLATAGSLVGACVTFYIGCKVGENSLDCWIPEPKLKSIQKKVKDKGAIALAIPGLLPPPFPLTPFILACGALKVRRRTFFLTLAGARLLRFSVAAILALLYGRSIIGVLESDIFKLIITGFVLIAVVGSAYSAYRVIRSTRKHRGKSGSKKAA
jgi:membrane protein YqaA with SNARE-associated domain